MILKFIMSFLILLCIKVVCAQKTDRLYIYQKDISEHCRRRATPSVFLGRHVISSNSKILHFSRKDLPYSCSIIIRAESGSNIIMMVQLYSVEDLEKSCNANPGQLVVYQMGETFGGYWGSIPHELLKEQRSYSKYYTLKTTTTTKSTPTTRRQTSRSTRKTTKKSTDDMIRKQDNYIRIDVPLVNVSVQLVPGDLPLSTKDSDMAFDELYDVTPIPGVKYDTTMIPIAEFAVQTEPVTERLHTQNAFLPHGKKDAQGSSRMQFTPDVRLSFPEFLKAVTRRKPRIKDYNYNKLSKLKPRNPFQRRGRTRKRPFASEYNRRLFLDDFKPKDFSNHSTDSSNFLDRILDLFEKENEQRKAEESEEYKNISMFLRNMTDAKYNLSAYLFPKGKESLQLPISSTAKQFKLDAFTNILSLKNKPNDVSTHVPSVKEHTNINFEVSTLFTNSAETIEKKTINITTSKHISETDYHLDFKNTELNNYGTEETTKNETMDIVNYLTTSSASKSLVHTKINPRTTTLTTNLVDHESWDNVVQVAPVMAVLLNQTVLEDIATSEKVVSATTEKAIKREKRYIQVIPIEKARPHKMTTPKFNTTMYRTTNIQIPDMQDFAQLVELYDDEIHGRVALRYIRNYFGSSIYNICDFKIHNKAPRAVFLFNTSRIVITLSNYSMERMTIVLTPGRTVLGTKSVCPINHLECQVTGARVCIDSMNACDGLPNCGAYDIYDEDRVRCGRTMGLQHNVALAAFAFVSVLLTSLYGVHYWLKRCVPAVSDAFFVYINGADNILYLETIMKAPTDLLAEPDDDASKRALNSHLYRNLDEELFSTEKDATGDEFKTSFFSNIMRLFCKKKPPQEPRKRDTSAEIMQTEYADNIEKPFYFAEFELNRVIEKDLKDASIQTGGSLELRTMEKEISLKTAKLAARDSLQLPQISQAAATFEKTAPLEKQERSRVDNEINAMRFFRQSKLQSDESSSIDAPSRVEREMSSTSYDQNASKKRSMQHSDAAQAKKHLRFDEEATLMASASALAESTSGLRPSILTMAKTKRIRHDPEIAEDDNKIAFSRFWKGKKGTKKKQQSVLK